MPELFFFGAFWDRSSGSFGIALENWLRSLHSRPATSTFPMLRPIRGTGSRGGTGCLTKRGRADGMMPEAAPRVADAGWHQPAYNGPAGHQTSSAFHLAGTLELTWSIGRRMSGPLHFVKYATDAAIRRILQLLLGIEIGAVMGILRINTLQGLAITVYAIFVLKLDDVLTRGNTIELSRRRYVVPSPLVRGSCPSMIHTFHSLLQPFLTPSRAAPAEVARLVHVR